MSRVLTEFKSRGVDAEKAQDSDISDAIYWQTVEFFDFAHGAFSAFAECAISGKFLFLFQAESDVQCLL